MTKQRAIVFAAIAFVVAALDGAFKIAAQNLPSDSTQLSWPIDLALHKNAGIVFNIPLSLGFVIPITVVVCFALVAIGKRAWIAEPGITAACALIFFGAVGNLVDRMINNYTTDYIIFFSRSAVNLADGLILIGAITFAWYSHRRSAT